MTNDIEGKVKGDILGALARGYCTKRNSQKVLDPDLIQDMAVELLSLIPKKEITLMPNHKIPMKRKKSLVGWLPSDWDLKILDRYGKQSICPVSPSKYNKYEFHQYVRAKKYCNDDSQVKVRITLEEI